MWWFSGRSRRLLTIQRRSKKRKWYLRVKFCQKCSLGLGIRFGEIVILLLLLLLWLLMLLLLLLLLILLRLRRVRGRIRFWWRIVIWSGIGR
jgi:hypothetical protein